MSGFHFSDFPGQFYEVGQFFLKVGRMTWLKVTLRAKKLGLQNGRSFVTSFCNVTKLIADGQDWEVLA
jgi:hypothetical protein